MVKCTLQNMEERAAETKFKGSKTNESKANMRAIIQETEIKSNNEKGKHYISPRNQTPTETKIAKLKRQNPNPTSGPVKQRIQNRTNKYGTQTPRPATSKIAREHVLE